MKIEIISIKKIVKTMEGKITEKTNDGRERRRKKQR